MTEVPATHPDDDALRALSLGQLAEDVLERVSAHRHRCPERCRRIDQVTTDDLLIKRLQESSTSGEHVLGTPDGHRSAARALRRAHVDT